MSDTLYRKSSRGRYDAVAWHDPAVMDAMPQGCHLVIVSPGGKSVRYNVDPTAAPLLAALRMAQDRVVEATRKITEPRPGRKTTAAEKRAWRILRRELPIGLLQMSRASIMEMVEAMESELVRIVQEGGK